MSIKDELSKEAKRVSKWATRKHFEMEGYAVSWGDEDDDYWGGWWIFGRNELTVERYNDGPYNGDVADDLNSDWYVSQDSEIWRLVYGDYDWVDHVVTTTFGNADLAALEQVRDKLKEVLPHVRADVSWASADEDPLAEEGSYPEEELLLVTALAELKNWNGAAATAFRDLLGKQGEKWEAKLGWNYILLKALIACLDAELSLIVALRSDVSDIMGEAVGLLKVVDQNPGGQTAVKLALLAAVVGFGFSLAGSKTGAFGSLAAGAFSVNNAAVGAEADLKAAKKATEHKIEGGSPTEILDSMKTALDAAVTAFAKEEEGIADPLREVVGVTEDKTSRFELTLGKGEADIRDDESGDAMGSRQTSAETDQLNEVATYTFPVVAGHMTVANNLVAETAAVGGDPFAAEVYADSSHASECAQAESWRELRDLSQRFLGTNADMLEAIGSALLAASADYEGVDKDNADKSEKVYDELETVKPGDKPADSGSGFTDWPEDPSP